METSAKLYSLFFGNVKTYLFALLFVAGNIALPQLCHLVPAGGQPLPVPVYAMVLPGLRVIARKEWHTYVRTIHVWQ